MSERGFFTVEQVPPMFGGGRRDWSVDVLRCVSCFMVCALHSSWLTMPQWYGVISQPGTVDWMSGAAYRVLFGSPTVLFVMVSGIFFLSPERHVTAGRIWRKNVIKMACAYMFWCAVYAAYRIWMMDPQPELTAKFLFSQWLIEPEHLWYIPMIIGLYILAPILRPITATRDTGLFRYLIIIFLAALVLHTIYTWPEFPFGEFAIFPILDKTPMDLLCQYMFWMLFGWIAYTYRPGKKLRYFIYAMGIAMAIAGFLISLGNLTYAGDFQAATVTRKFTIVTFCKNVALFYFIVTTLRDHEFSRAGKKVLGKLSGATLIIYLIHWLFLQVMFDHQFLYGSGMSPWIGTWIYAGIAYVGGGIIAVLFQTAWKGIKGKFRK